MYRILDLKPIGTEEDVLITYFDDETLETHKILKKQAHIIPSIEILEEKYSIEKIITELEQNYPESAFEAKPYGGVKGSKIIWQKGPRKNKKNLEYFVTDQKQIFLTNQEHRFYPRTIPLQNPESYLKKLTKINGVKTAKIRADNTIELLTNKEALKELPQNIFKIIQYDSKTLELEEAKQKKQRIKQTLKSYIDGLSIIETKEGYKVRVRTINHERLKQKFSNFLKPEINAKEITYDPLNLNSPLKQLRDTHPLYTEFDPEKTLEEQINLEIFPHKEENLEQTIQKTLNYFKANTAVIDLEVTDYINEPTFGKKIISGNIFMAVLKSQTENKLYITKKAHNKKIREKTHFEGELIFLENEEELIKKINEDAKKHQFIMGYNIDDYDQLHLKKLNIAGDVWEKKQNNILDGFRYAKNRIKLLKDKKLSSLGDFNKSISYEEMENLLQQKTPETIQKIINYTAEDGQKTWEVLTNLLNQSIIESIATNKPLTSVFRAKPSKNFYDAEQRKYFINLNTYRDRHEFSQIKFFNKFKNRETNEEIISDLIPSNNELKKLEGTLYYSDIFIESFKEMIIKNPYLKHIYQETHKEKNPLKKLISISTLSGALTVSADKIKNHLERNNLKFGEIHNTEDLYRENNTENHFKINQESTIFAKTYGISNYKKSFEEKTLDITMLNINNKIAQRLNDLKTDYVIANLSLNANQGIPLGQLRAITLNKDELIGKLENLHITIGKNFPKNEYLKNLLNTYLENQYIDTNKWLRTMPKDLNDSQKKIVKAILQINPAKHKTNTLYLF